MRAAAERWAEFKPRVDTARDFLQAESNSNDRADIMAAGVIGGYFEPRELPSYDAATLERLVPAWDLERLEPNTFFPVPASVAFARKCAADTPGKPLAGTVERWRGKAGSKDVRREGSGITDTGVVGDSPYAVYTREGSTLVPRCLFFVHETENTAIVQAAPTVTVNPRRGSLDKAPWKDLDLTAINGQTVEDSHLFNVHLGETLVPYATLQPLRALLPLKHGDAILPADDEAPGGIRMGGLERRMRARWRTVSRLWEEEKTAANKKNLLEQLDYYGKLSYQLEWRRLHRERPVRVVYNQSGTPTAALLDDDEAIVDYTLFWTTCKDEREANYLLAIINSDALATAVNQYTVPNWAGNTRHLHKHLWKLPIPEFDPTVELHAVTAEAGETATSGARQRLAELREDRGDKLTVTIARRELRKWLRASTEGNDVETAVARLLAGGWK